MGRWGQTALSLFIGSSFAFAWVTDRRTNNEYATRLGIDPHVTVQIQLPDDGACTGTFISDTTLITAAHCVAPDVKGGGLNVDGIESLAYFASEKFNFSDLEDPRSSDKFDIALAVFPTGTGRILGIQKYPALSQELQIDKSILKRKLSLETYLVGFGLEGMSVVSDKEGLGLGEREDIDLGAGVRGWGKVNLTRQGKGVLTSSRVDLPLFVPLEEGEQPDEPTPEDRSDAPLSAGLLGDSGSSLFSKNGKILGVLSSMQCEGTIDARKDLGEEEIENLKLEEMMEVRHQVRNNYVDVSSRPSRDLFRKAVLCEKGPCADNFPGSGVTETEKAYPTLQQFSAADFDHITVRTGSYSTAKNGEATLFLTPRYEGKKLVYVDYRKVHKETLSPVSTFECRNKTCRSLDERTVIEVSKEGVRIREGARRKSKSTFYTLVR